VGVNILNHIIFRQEWDAVQWASLSRTSLSAYHQFYQLLANQRPSFFNPATSAVLALPFPLSFLFRLPWDGLRWSADRLPAIRAGLRCRENQEGGDSAIK